MHFLFSCSPLGVILVLAGGSPPPAGPADLAAMVRNTPPGGVLTLPPDHVFRIAEALTIDQPITIEGRGASVIAADGARMAGALIRSTGVAGVRLSGLIVDANVDRQGADYGISIIGGTGHRIADVTVRDTSQACLYLQDAAALVEGNTLERCGRALTIARGTAANDHGILVAALTGSVAGVVIRRNTVANAHRKGITTYARAPGSLTGITIAENTVTECGLGGIYIANAPGAAPQRAVTVTGNVVERSYVGFQIADTTGLLMANNRATGARGRSASAGAQGVVLNNVTGATVTGMVVENSGASGMLVRDSEGVRIVAPVVLNANIGGHAFAAGIHFSNTRNSSAEEVSVVDDRARPLTTHGVVQNDGSAGNVVTVRRIMGVLRPLLTTGPR